MKRKLLTAILILLAIAGWAMVLLQSRHTPPERIITRLIEHPTVDSSPFDLTAPDLAGAAIGFCLLGPDGSLIHESPLARTALAPASTLKAVTTATALAILGPEFRFKTALRSTVPPDASGTIQGDLVLSGGGDPTLTTKDLESLAQQLVAKGIKSITGTLRIDATMFPHDPTSEHWNWGDVGNAYGVGAFGINVDHNVMLIRLQPGGETGAPTSIISHHNSLPDLTWHNHTTTGLAGTGDGVVIYSEPYGRRITLRGTVPLGGELSVRAAIPDPPALASAIMTKALKDLGIPLSASAPSSSSIHETHDLALHESAPLTEIITHCHRVSDNLEAQCIFLMIGKVTGKNPINAIRDHWQEQGAELTAWRLLDGSGLARANMIRPLDLATILHLALNSAHGEVFRNTLNASRDGRARSKLGAMSGVRSDTGFIRMPDGSTRTFAIIANGLTPQANLWALRDRLIDAALDMPTPTQPE